MERPKRASLGHPALLSGAARAKVPDTLAKDNESAHHDRETPRRDPQSAQTPWSPITIDRAAHQPVAPTAYPPSEFRRRAETQFRLGTGAADPLLGLPDSRPHSHSTLARDGCAPFPWRPVLQQSDSRAHV